MFDVGVDVIYFDNYMGLVYGFIIGCDFFCLVFEFVVWYGLLFWFFWCMDGVGEDFVL